MDRRPQLSEQFALLAYQVFEAHDLIDGDSVDQGRFQEAIAVARDTIFNHFTSDSIEFPDGRWVSTDDSQAAQAFLAKYPQLQEFVDLARTEANKRFDNPGFVLEVHSDPEGCHVCREGQHLVLCIQTNLAFYNEDGEMENSPYDLADEAWMDWLVSEESPWYKLIQESPEVSHLIRTDLQWAEDEE